MNVKKQYSWILRIFLLLIHQGKIIIVIIILN